MTEKEILKLIYSKEYVPIIMNYVYMYTKKYLTF